MWKYYKLHFMQYFAILTTFMLGASLYFDLNKWINNNQTNGNFIVHVIYTVVLVKIILNFFITVRKDLDKHKEEMTKK